MLLEVRPWQGFAFQNIASVMSVEWGFGIVVIPINHRGEIIGHLSGNQDAQGNSGLGSCGWPQCLEVLAAGLYALKRFRNWGFGFKV